MLQNDWNDSINAQSSNDKEYALDDVGLYES
jgi:hypothetical protein